MEVKRAKVHMLPTEKQSNIELCGSLLRYSTFRVKSNAMSIFQHLYFTTDELPKFGEWCYSIRGFVGKFGEFENSYENECSKIIATTDPKLKVLNEEGLKGMNELHVLSPYSKAPKSWYNYLPQPSQDFIKAYCEQGGIDEVDVEYECLTSTHTTIVDYSKEPIETEALSEPKCIESRLKVDPIHNTITTHRIVEKKYSIDDIEAYCDKYPNDAELGREIRKLRYKQ